MNRAMEGPAASQVAIIVSAQASELDNTEKLIGIALYTSSTMFNSGMSVFAKLLGERPGTLVLAGLYANLSFAAISGSPSRPTLASGLHPPD